MGKWNLPPSGGHMDLPDGIYLQNMNIVEIRERVKKNDVIIIPVGSTENHGPAACTGEDTFLVTRMAELVAKKNRLHRSSANLVWITSLSPCGYARDYYCTRRNLQRAFTGSNCGLLEYGL